MLRLYDTAAGAVVPFQPRDPGRVSMYVCGPTVYAPPHVGHGRFSLVFDVLRRYLEWSGLEVDYVSNITDVDDNIVNRASEEGRSEAEVVEEYERLWVDAMAAIGVKPPTNDPHATAYVERMVGFIAGLVEGGKAYETSDGVYFSVESVADYGLLARQDLDTLQAGARVQVDDDKRSPVDFALWKRVDDDGSLSWDSPWGRGRPGWHTECVVMSLDLLGEGFDIHGGGQDLAFPHHENERAQAAAAGRPFAAHWVHNGFVEVGGEKMSKSLGNFTTLVDLIENTDPRAYRLLVLQAHYRSPIEVTPVTTENASKALAGLDRLASRAAALPDAPPDAESIDQLRTRMDDDLDTPAVTALLFTLAKRINALLDDGRADEAAPLWAAVGEISTAVGLELHGEAAEVPADVQALAGERDRARADKDWARADAIRDRLQAGGWTVEDAPDGTVVRPG